MLSGPDGCCQGGRRSRRRYRPPKRHTPGTSRQRRQRAADRELADALAEALARGRRRLDGS